MKQIRKTLIALVAAAGLLTGCQKVDDKFEGMMNNPNSPNPAAADADLYMSRVQLSFASFFNTASSFGMELTRQIVMYGPTYSNAYVPESFDGIWSNAYTQINKHANALIPIATSQKKFVNVGMAKIMKAYTMMTMVDMFGNVPYSEANLGDGNTNPKVDAGKDVYAAAITLLDEAIAVLTPVPGSYPGVQDLYYGATNATGKAKWITLAKTLKLRAYMTTRLVDNTASAKIAALLTENDLIDTPAEDFEFKYSTKQAAPNSRHPRYNSNYTSTGSAGDYMGTHFMWALARDPLKGSFTNNPATAQGDPRARYYIYRQRTNYADVNVNSASCAYAPKPGHYTADMPYCLIGSGFWGRDHGDGSGIPPDGPARSTVGIYPFGGDFDRNQGASVGLNRGGQGAGIQPIWSSFFTDFLKAEAKLALGLGVSTADACVAKGISGSFTKVLGFAASIGAATAIDPAYVPTQVQLDAYVAKVMGIYAAATTDAERMNVIMNEYYLALWGNGVDSYNNYRRTGKPGNFQYTILASPGSFIRSHFYPSVHVNLNQNGTQKPGVAVQVYWDNNPAGFIK